jgi:hypothetical protein
MVLHTVVPYIEVVGMLHSSWDQKISDLQNVSGALRPLLLSSSKIGLGNFRLGADAGNTGGDEWVAVMGCWPSTAIIPLRDDLTACLISSCYRPIVTVSRYGIASFNARHVRPGQFLRTSALQFTEPELTKLFPIEGVGPRELDVYIFPPTGTVKCPP